MIGIIPKGWLVFLFTRFAYNVVKTACQMNFVKGPPTITVTAPPDEGALSFYVSLSHFMND